MDQCDIQRIDQKRKEIYSSNYIMPEGRRMKGSLR
jgi:hypothetical protein